VPDKSGNYKNLEVKGFQNAENERKTKLNSLKSIMEVSWKND
jgi:hypothetical protein